MSEENELDDEKIWKALSDLADQIPVETISQPEPLYDQLDPQKEGSWKTVEADSTPIGYVWTDWENGLGYLAIQSSDANQAIRDYIRNAFKLSIPAGTAYSSLDTYFDGKVSVAQTESGPLNAILPNDVEPEEIDNGDE